MFTMASSSLVLIFGFILSSTTMSAPADENTVLSKLAYNPEISEMYGMIERSGYSVYMQRLSATWFIPTNEAFQKSKPSIKDENLVGYHLLATPTTLDKFRLSSPLSTVGSGSAPVYITKTRDNEYYVNNAKMWTNNSFHNIMSPTSSSRHSIYIINEVLQPLRPKKDDLRSPLASELLETSDYNLGIYQISAFADRVNQLRKNDIFRNSGPNTYFIPVGDTLSKSKFNKIDAKVIDGHVIFNKVLFLNPTPEKVEFETGAFTDSMKVLASLSSNTYNGRTKRYVTSHTIVGDTSHPTGSVLSEILLPNIPIQNGVVHLIKQPLMIIDKTVQQFIDDNGVEDGLISIFKDKLKYAGDVFRQKLNGHSEITLFIPTNTAWRDSNVELTLSNNTSLLSHILDLHLVSKKLTVSNIRDGKVLEFPSLWKEKYLYFNVKVQGDNMTLTVEGNGGNATVLHPDLGAINGVIHIIDRVLGIPYATVARKVATDPVLNHSHSLGNIEYTHGRFRNFNERLDDISKNFTYFVPRNPAWELFKDQYPQLYGSLYKGGVASNILEKHLIEGFNYTMADLKKLLQNGSYLLQTSNGGLNIKVKEEQNGYSILWNNKWIPVYRADVRCTNGIIHIIDQVLISDKDNIQVPVDSAFRNDHPWQLLFLSILPFGIMVFYH